MRVGGRVEWLLEPATPEELVAAWCAARERAYHPRILGGGANLIVADGLLPGVVIATERLRRVFRPSPEASSADALASSDESATTAPHARIAQGDPRSDPRLVAWCGASMPGLVRIARDLGLSGLEGLVGVPGHLGGGIAMNAGGRWGAMWDVVERVRLLDGAGEVIELAREQCSPRYRDGALGERIVLGAVLRLAPDSKSAIQERLNDYLCQKRTAQPVTEWSAGCIFQNPPAALSNGRSAGRLIEDCGGKSLARGDAVVSPLHANFIVNRGKASAADVFALIEDVRDLVLDRSGITLEREVKVWLE
jgi:UDP-N-acetylmuramate dehydrogenase